MIDPVDFRKLYRVGDRVFAELEIHDHTDFSVTSIYRITGLVHVIDSPHMCVQSEKNGNFYWLNARDQGVIELISRKEERP